MFYHIRHQYYTLYKYSTLNVKILLLFYNLYILFNIVKYFLL